MERIWPRNSFIISHRSVEARNYWISCISEKKIICCSDWVKSKANGHTVYINGNMAHTHMYSTLASHCTWRHTWVITCTWWDGQSACGNQCGSSYASFNMSRSGHQKPSRAETCYLAFLCLFSLSLFSSYLFSPLSLCISFPSTHTHCQQCIIGG